MFILFPFFLSFPFFFFFCCPFCFAALFPNLLLVYLLFIGTVMCLIPHPTQRYAFPLSTKSIWGGIFFHFYSCSLLLFVLILLLDPVRLLVSAVSCLHLFLSFWIFQLSFSCDDICAHSCFHFFSRGFRTWLQELRDMLSCSTTKA